ncbi:hypothetical protein B0H17DRAFT_1128083 [Mycena rosella]|uniref:Uncharacterized protein n=1 Tax=Mycena rosella TaxID=1033263 RepID=A0AAD7GQP4_MYCRO|nr:hypothetical protein B0H17DRAFT_1128083 [Mycena rosella]
MYSVPESDYYQCNAILERKKWRVISAPRDGKVFNLYNGRPMGEDNKAESNPGGVSTTGVIRSLQTVQGGQEEWVATGKIRISCILATNKTPPLIEDATQDPVYEDDNTPAYTYSPESTHLNDPADQTLSSEPFEYEDDSENQYLENMNLDVSGYSPLGVPGDKDGYLTARSARSELPGMPGGPYWENVEEAAPLLKTEHFNALLVWAAAMTSMTNEFELKEIVWDAQLLNQGILIFDDPRGQSMGDLLTMAIKYAVPFQLYIRMRDLPLFIAHDIPDVERISLPATLELGFSETGLKWLGAHATRTVWVDLVAKMLCRPYAGVFLAKGGIMNRIAPFIDKDLPVRFAKGRLRESQSTDGGS